MPEGFLGGYASFGVVDEDLAEKIDELDVEGGVGGNDFLSGSSVTKNLDERVRGAVGGGKAGRGKGGGRRNIPLASSSL